VIESSFSRAELLAIIHKDNMPKLSYSLRKYDYAMYILNLEVRQGLAKVDPVIGEIPSVPTSHGGVMRQVSEPTVVETPMKAFSADVTVEGEWLRKTDVGTFVGILWHYCQELIAQSTRYLFEIVSQTSEAVGNVTDGKNMNIWDAQIESMKKLEMRFDKDGNHGVKFYPSSPQLAEKMKANPPTLEQQKKMEEVIKAKREEYNAKKRTRRLS
jgi:hypothetical protein